ncbi:hypothetical protein OBK20_01330 [Empedobacter falsenii]|uniref:Uncharacterized protein n=1 Tax=Empedobacter stercoris TaxID=1628248 RepID=A0ABX1WJ38_9FLAO|nr:hypothetical protein [Empedobacter stercoris]MCA4808662.1 hypothetical protein [Empedobacter stercoris]NOJ74664.1 hypothetical protein [Empedobacter stercoris]QNT13674.1 hypothetical protein HNV03_02785 [Empedobacter stercoris]
MKQIYLLFIVLISTLTFGQYNADEVTVDVVPYWNKGDVFEYEIIESTYEYNKFDTISKKQSKYDLKLSIIDSTNKSYTLKWETKFQLPVDEPEIKKLIEKKYKELSNYTIIYQTDEFGTVENIINLKEIKKYYRKIFDLAFSEKNLKKSEKDIIYQFVDNDELFQNYLMQDLNQYHHFYGNHFSKTPLVNEVDLTNPFTNSPLQYKQIYSLIDINEEDETYTLKMDQLIDEEKLINDIEENFGSKKSENLDVSFLFNMKQITHNSGVILYSIFSKVVENEGKSKSNLKEFILN